MIDLKVTGLKESILQTQQARDALRRGEVMADACRVWRMTVLPRVKAECPVDTGDVRDSHRTRMEGNNFIIEAMSPDAVHPYHGTTKQAPNPWIDRGVVGALPLLEKLIQTELAKRLK